MSVSKNNYFRFPWLVPISLILILLFFIPLFKSSSKKSAQKAVTITFWNMFTAGGPGDAIKTLVKEFNETHPYIQVKILDIPQQIEQKLLTATAGGVPPDVAMFDRFRVASFAARNAFRCLDDFILRDKIKATDFFKPCWEECKYQEKMWAMPFNTDVRVLFYNKDLFKEAGLDPERPPRTWDELIEYSDKLTKRDKLGRLTQVGFVPIWGNTWLYLYGWQKGGEFINEDGTEITCNDPKIVAALEWVVNFVDRYKIESLNSFSSGFGAWELNPFFTGKIAMQGDEGYLMSLIKRYAPKLNYDVAPLPYPKDGVRATWSGGFALVIPRGAKNAEAAWEFIKWMTSPKPQFTYAKMSEQMSANKLAMEDPYFMNDPKWRVFISEMEYSRYRPVTPVGAELWDQLARAVDQCVYHKMTPKQALDEAKKKTQRALDEFIKQRNYPFVNWKLVILIFLFILGVPMAWRATKSCKIIKASSLLKKEHILGYIFILPWILGFITFTAGPILVSIVYSFCNYEILTPAQFLGLENYRRLFFEDSLFYKSLYNTIYYTIFAVPLGMATALFLALLLNLQIKGKNWYRTIYFLPSVVPLVASSILWMWIFNPEFGLLNWILSKFGIRGPLWLLSEHWSKPALILMSLWGVGGGMVIYLAGLQNIPEQLYEAALIDGANRWHQFRYITLPMLSPTIFFTLVMGIIGSFQVFTQAYIMTGGGPVDSTLFYVFYLFNNAFGFLKMGYASAMAWILFIIILTLTLIQLKLAKKWVYYEGELR